MNNTKIFKFPNTSKMNTSLKDLLNDGYKLEIVSLKKLARDNNLMSNDELDYHTNLWGTDASKYVFDDSYVNTWYFSDIMYAVRKKDNRIILNNGRHRCRALINSGYDYIEIPVINEN